MLRQLAGAVCLVFLAACPTDPGGSDSGNGQDSGAGACTQASCATGQRCDGATGQCVTGCDEASDCTAPQVCDFGTNSCGCPPATHLCGTACVSDTSTQSCGSSCSPCAADPNGTATCAAATCGVTCNANALFCDTACAVCPAGTATGMCNGAACDVVTCQAGRLLCQSQCPACPPGAATTACSGATCVATACGVGQLLCGGQCPVCPTGAATTACNGTACQATACNSGTLLCQGQCPACPAQATATTCTAGACVATACNAGFVVCGAGCAPCAPGQLFCCKEVVDPTIGSGPDHAIGIDATGRVHVAYYASGNTLRLARSGPGGFTITVIDTAGDVGQGVSIAVDAAGNAHLAYTRTSNPLTIKYAYVPVSGAPVVETVESNRIEVGRTAIALDDQGAVHIAYYADGDARYATKRGGFWVPRYAMQDGRQVSMAIAGAIPHLVASSNPSLGVAVSSLSYGWLDAGTTDGGAFTERGVTSTVGVNAYHEATLTLDPGGVPFVAYTHPNFRDLRLSILDGGDWSTSTVFNGLTGDAWIQMSATGPRIAFNGTPGAGAVTYRPRYAELSDGGWAFTVIDNKDITVGTLRMVLDAQGRPHVTLYDPDPSVRRVYYLH